MSSKVGDSLRYFAIFATSMSYVIKATSSLHASETDCYLFSVSLTTSCRRLLNVINITNFLFWIFIDNMNSIMSTVSLKYTFASDQSVSSDGALE